MKVALIDGKKPHHIYNPQEDGPTRLCVFYPKTKEWNDNMFFADAFVPWVVTWLSTYEYWQISGIWVYPESADINWDRGCLSKLRILTATYVIRKMHNM